MTTPKFISGFFLVVICILIFAGNVFSQDKKTDTIKIKTSAVCGMCKDRIEGGLAFEKGVRDVTLDVDTKIVMIRYNAKSISPDELRKKISKLGYDADSIEADPSAYKKLPPCCKKDASKH